MNILHDTSVQNLGNGGQRADPVSLSNYRKSRYA